MRTFIAIELDPDAKRKLLQLLRTFPRADGVRWVTEQQLHITLKFLGDVSDQRIADVCDAAAAASATVKPFELRLAPLGVFPAPRNPRVLWCGVEDPTAGCERWVQAADTLFEPLGFKPETRRYTPHITLGRSRSTAGGHILRDTLESATSPQTTFAPVTQVVVFESRLLPSGAQYRPVAKIPLPPA